MEHHKTITIPERQSTVFDYKTCDLCKKKIEEEYGEKSEVTMLYSNGYHYPEGGGGTEQIFDVCPDCWNDKIVPFMEGQGALFRIREWDY
jgi:hypothetical protein